MKYIYKNLILIFYFLFLIIIILIFSFSLYKNPYINTQDTIFTSFKYTNPNAYNSDAYLNRPRILTSPSQTNYPTISSTILQTSTPIPITETEAPLTITTTPTENTSNLSPTITQLCKEEILYVLLVTNVTNQLYSFISTDPNLNQIIGISRDPNLVSIPIYYPTGDLQIGDKVVIQQHLDCSESIKKIFCEPKSNKYFGVISSLLNNSELEIKVTQPIVTSIHIKSFDNINTPLIFRGNIQNGAKVYVYSKPYSCQTTIEKF